MENSKKELKMEEMNQVVAGLAMMDDAERSWADFIRGCRTIGRAIYNKYFATGENAD